MIPISNFFKLKMFVNGPGGLGFSESYKFATYDPTTAIGWAKDICDNRALLLALNEKIVWATLSLSDAAHDSYVPGQPVASSTGAGKYLNSPQADADATDGAGAGPVEVCNSMDSGLLWRFTSASGKTAAHLLRGMRDSWIANQAAVTGGSVTLVVPGSWVTPAPNFAAADAVNQFLSAVFYRTAYIRKKGGGGFEYEPWEDVGFVRVAKRDCGPGYSLSRGRKKHVLQALAP